MAGAEQARSGNGSLGLKTPSQPFASSVMGEAGEVETGGCPSTSAHPCPDSGPAIGTNGISSRALFGNHSIVMRIDCQLNVLYLRGMSHQDKNEITLPALLRAARAVYGSAIRESLELAGYEDVPKNGIFVIGAIARGGAPLANIIRDLGVSKQAGGQLVDTLVTRGYLAREVDMHDRRRLTVSLTERGRAAAQVSRKAVDGIDTDLAARVKPVWIEHTRATLLALIGE
ncbi:MAG: winged helix DNA-binding protein [Proteobacteria bacterium]|nr:winged helix DNA-binding protein [Pseudomonadota bacterium]